MKAVILMVLLACGPWTQAQADFEIPKVDPLYSHKQSPIAHSLDYKRRKNAQNDWRQYEESELKQQQARRELSLEVRQILNPHRIPASKEY